VLLHGKGAGPSQFLSQRFFNTLAGLGGRAPDVLLLDGGDDSYWHNRADGKWGSMILREGIRAGVDRPLALHVAIGGISVGRRDRTRRLRRRRGLRSNDVFS
jgi:hypothetical protein